MLFSFETITVDVPNQLNDFIKSISDRNKRVLKLAYAQEHSNKRRLAKKSPEFLPMYIHLLRLYAPSIHPNNSTRYSLPPR
jgi:hypothetical protein